MRTIRLSIGCALMLSVAVASAAQQKDEPVYKPGDGITLPRVVKEFKPQYTPNALQERVQGTVVLECVVSSAGKVRDVEVVKALHEELDAEAVETLKLWEFEPGKKDDKPVAVRVHIEMTFTLK